MGARTTWSAAIVLTAALGLASPAAAQYFGRNKVQYRTFDFQILRTDHFDLYYYPEEKEAADLASRLGERWYARLSQFFNHQLRGRQVLILYAAPSHFRQTNAVEGLIGEGTGGVTEGLRRRIVLPMSGSLADTNHVLGHELVHAFQFDMTGADPRDVNGGAPGIAAFPLWYVEGMAEYLSLGPVDAQTAMWLRDAAIHEKLPAIKDLDNPKYFPYRWGHAFWAYIGARYGDRTVASLVRSAANPRFDLVGLARQLGTTPDALTAAWHDAIRQSANAALANQPSLESAPREIIGHDTGSGRYNIGPKLSPDGTQVAFFSEKDRFAIELYLANAETGKIERKLIHASTDPHYDSLEFLDSAGAWSPDGRLLALTAIRGGDPVLALLDPKSGDVRREIPLHGLDDAINPAFSPDGTRVVVSGNQGGLSDLYLVTLATGAVDRLTHDPFADLEPVFTPDGRSIIFVTERFSTDLTLLQAGPLRLARLDVATRTVTPVPGFLRGKHLSPQVSADGTTLTFIAEPDGISNLYRMAIDGGPISQISSFATGVAGITSSSPALSASAATGRLAFSVFEDDGHSIYVLEPDKIVSLVSPETTERGALLPGRSAPSGDLDRLLSDPARGLPPAAAAPPSAPDTHKLLLDGIAQPTLSVGVSQWGTYGSGGIAASWSDMLGDRELGLGAQVGGRFIDFGAQAVYVNRRHRWNWATAFAQIPAAVGFISATRDPNTNNINVQQIVDRQTGPGGYFVTSYPFNQTTRVEFGGDVRSLSFSEETMTEVLSPDGRTVVSRQDVRTPLETPLHLAEGTTALVHDTAFYGATSPIYGNRYRLSVTETAGTIRLSTVSFDWRRYFMPIRPLTIAVRALHIGRYGPGAEDTHLVPLFAGYSDLVRGYGFGSITPAECQTVALGQCPVLDNLVGSRMLVGNFEVRAPLVGLFRGDLQYGRVPIEVAAFMDAGVTWSHDSRPTFAGGTRPVFRSVGGAARINAFGLVIVEISAAHPLDRPSGGLKWQIGLMEGF